MVEDCGNRAKWIRIATFSGLVLILVCVAFWQASRPGVTGDSTELFAELRPIEEPRGEFVSSDNCLSCHENNHASWEASYHRTMTQVARADRSMGKFTNQVVSFFGDRERYQLFEHLGLPWIRSLQPGQPPGPLDDSDDAMPALLTTGSHNMQAYWMPSGRGRQLNLMPLIYLKETEEWIPRRAAFLHPPSDEISPEYGRWNTTCIKCHTTDGRMNLPEDQRTGTPDSKASEFGISCEACHGGGRSHIDFQRRRAVDSSVVGKDPIVNPATVSHAHSAQVCGGCHSVHLMEDLDHWTAPSAAGDLEAERVLFDYDERTLDLLMTMAKEAGDTNDVEKRMESWFWKDGTPRVSGREYSGLRKSGCFTRGEMSCISCHSLHPRGLTGSAQKEWANDMLDPNVQGDASCIQCHESPQYASVEHTHHLPDSSGSRCQNCHMPHTTYGLLKAIRSHAILSPSARESTELGRPNACNLCHLDKSLQWTADRMTDWYGHKPLKLVGDQSRLGAGAVWALKGDASLRALTAWHMGWKPAQETSGSDWMPAYLSILLSDPYDAIRYVAYRSVRSIDSYRDFEYDFLATTDERRQRGAALYAEWSRRHGAKSGRPDLLIADSGKIDRVQFDRLLQARDDRPIILLE